LTEIYLCRACSCQEILRAETAGQAARKQALAEEKARKAAERRAAKMEEFGDDYVSEEEENSAAVPAVRAQRALQLTRVL
jgi:hypothetical protein